jgi:hypothetical protein
VRAGDVEPAVSPGLILAILILTIFGCVGSTLFAQRIANSVDAGALSIATNAVHGGRIWIEDNAPGTAVSFTLPRDRSEGI